MNAFKHNIKYLRSLKKLKQHEFADELNVKSASISNWELGYAYPTMDILFQFRIHFNLSLDDLLTINLKDKYEDSELIKIINQQEKGVINNIGPGNKTETMTTKEKDNLSSLTNTIAEMSKTIATSTNNNTILTESTLHLTEANLKSSNTIETLIKLISEK